MNRLPLVADANCAHSWPTLGRLLLACNQALSKAIPVGPGPSQGITPITTIADCAARLAVAHRHRITAAASEPQPVRRRTLRAIDTEISRLTQLIRTLAARAHPVDGEPSLGALVSDLAYVQAQAFPQTVDSLPAHRYNIYLTSKRQTCHHAPALRTSPTPHSPVRS